MKSESCGELFKALAEAQAKFPAIPRTKTATMGSYSYSYADLADVLDGIREPLHAAGLAVSQLIETGGMLAEGRGLVLTTMLGHSSGEWLQSTYPLNQHQKPQEMGSEITYARRYALVSILGIATDDDDDAGAVSQKKSSREPIPAGGGAGRESPASSSATPVPEAPVPNPELLAKRQLYRSVCKGKKLDPETFAGKDLGEFDIGGLEELIGKAKAQG